jgi:hypothetical protein
MLSEIAVLLPISVPIVEAITDSANPLQIGINIDVPQKIGSAIAAIISNELIIKGAYQKLWGFSLIIKKHATAFIKPVIIYPNPSAFNNSATDDPIIIVPMRVISANAQLGFLAKNDFFLLVFIIQIIYN